MQNQELDKDCRDAVTGGGNEKWLASRYKEVCWYRNSKYAFILLNIKEFKKLFIRYGTEGAGDILKKIYHVILSLLHEDEYAARVYGDNFNLLLHRKDKEALIQFIFDLDLAIYSIEDERIYENVFLSFGAYMINDPGDDFYAAQNKASLCRVACYHTKLRNSSYEFYDDSFMKRYMRRCEIEELAVLGLEQNEIVPYLQPKVRLRDEKIVGAEVLLRWFDSKGKQVPLAEFLPVVNANGFIRNIDLSIFRKMCQMMEERLKQGFPMVPLSFNISKSYYDGEELISDYMEAFEKHQVPARYVEFELMESISFDDSERIIRIVSGLKRRGFACMLDDFGSGYSSFNVLSNIALDALKIDRQFFVEAFNAKDCSIVEAIVAIAKQLDMATVAEGVEDKKYVDFLKEIGCDMVQGFYYYEPMPAPAFLDLLSAQENR